MFLKIKFLRRLDVTKRYSVTEVDMKRYAILKKWDDGEITLKQCSVLLGLSYRQTLRLKERYLSEGFEGILRKKPDNPPNLKCTKVIEEEVTKLRKELYYDFNILHFKEKLASLHSIFLSYETIRKLLIKKGLHKPRKKKKVYRRRRRMPESGLLVQMDSSQYRWIEDISTPWWLIAMIDDADNFAYAEFFPKDTTKANMKVIKDFIKKKGIFMALYSDKASHFVTTRHGGLHNDVSLEHKDTQIERALKQLGISLINANSPQAKGRVERLFGFFQDRLTKELRLKGIKDYHSANKFLQEEFIPWYNQKYTSTVKNSYKEIPKSCNLDLIFSVINPRKAGNDNTIRYQGKVYQLLPLNGLKRYAGSFIDVCETLSGEIKLLYKDIEIPYKVLNEYEYKKIKEDEILNMREYLSAPKKKKKYIPPPNHPWRKNFSFQKIR
jgi:hypothetical protein